MQLFKSQTVAVISGAAQGIGKATALMLADYLNTLILLDINSSGLIEIQRQILATVINPQLIVDIYPTDVTQESEVKSVFAKIQQTYSRLDILINAVGGSSAAGNPGNIIEEMDLPQWQSLLNLNLTSTFLCCREAVPLMKRNRYGRIVNFSSIAAHGRRDKVSTAYAASKAGVEGFTRKLAHEIAPFGITCNAIASGITLTERIAEKFWQVRSATEQQALLNSIPLGRLSTPAEQAQIVLFLASEAVSYLTGQVIEVSGGI